MGISLVAAGDAAKCPTMHPAAFTQPTEEGSAPMGQVLGAAAKTSRGTPANHIQVLGYLWQLQLLTLLSC